MAEVLKGRYELLEVAGAGGEGTVVRSLDRQHDRLVALKIRSVRSVASREELLAEARVLLAVPPHPNLPLVREDFFDGDRYVIAMDWVQGTDLGALLRGEGRPGLPVPSVLRWLAEAAEALAHLHAQPVVHGDVKPANLVLGEDGRLRLVDFGLSSSPATRGRRGGTPGYVAPELAAGAMPSVASDVYALAATAWALLTGAPPSGERPSWDGIGAAEAAHLEEAIRAGLATDPARRPATPGELVERIRAGRRSDLPTGVLTFVLTDIVGSTARWSHDPDAMARALVRHDDVVARVVHEHGGELLKSMGEGDATVSVFTTAAAAVEAAAAIPPALAAEAWPGGEALRVRIGIHTGAAEQRGGDYFGATLSVAARLRSLASADEVFLSAGTAVLVREALPDGWGLVDLGPHRLAGIDRPVGIEALAAPGVATPPPVTECPYRGLRSFEAADADRYFGREPVVADVQRRLGASPRSFVAVVGSSGSGKSSLLRAGVAPGWPGARVVTPATATVGASGETTDELGGDALLVVDQFEELFTVVGEEARQPFVDALLARSGPTAIALRADFYGECTTVAGLADAVAADQLLLGPMDEAELRRAIEAPAAQAGLQLEPGLVDVLVHEVEGEPGALPLLSHALVATWERRDGRTLTLEGYRASGGVRGAIAASADRLLAELGDEDEHLARTVLLRLIEPGDGAADTRRRARLDELRPQDVAPERIDRVVGALADARLVTLDEGAAELSHEALIRAWPRLTSWLDEDRDRLRARRQLATAAAGWDERGRDRSELLRGARLASAVDALGDRTDASRLELDFVAASEAESDRVLAEERRARRRLRRLLAGVGVALVVALVAGGLALAARQRADDARADADASAFDAEARRVGTEALVVDDVDTSLLLAVEGYRLRPSAETAANLMAALQASPQAVGVTTSGGARLLRVAMLGDDALVTLDNQGTLRVVDPATLEVRSQSPIGEFVLRAAGDRLLTDGFDAGADQPVLRVLELDGDGALAVAVTIPLDGFVVDADLRPDGDQVAVVTDGEDGARFLVVDVADPDRPVVAEDADAALGASIDYSADGSRLAVMTSGTTRILDTATAAVVGTVDGTFMPTVLGPDGTTLAAPPRDFASEVAVRDVSTGATRAVLGAHTASVLGITFAADGARMATMGDDGDVLVWDTATGARLHTLSGHAGKVLDAAFSPDGETLFSVGLDSRVVAWDLAGRRTLARQRLGPLPDAPVEFPRSVLLDDAATSVAILDTEARGDLLQLGRIDAPAPDDPSEDGRDDVDGGGAAAPVGPAGGAARLLATGHGSLTMAAWLAGDGGLLTGGTDGLLRRWSATAGEPAGAVDGATAPGSDPPGDPDLDAQAPGSGPPGGPELDATAPGDGALGSTPTGDEPLAEVRLGATPTAALPLGDGAALVAAEDGRLFRLDVESMALEEVADLGGIPTRLAAAGPGRVVALTAPEPFVGADALALVDLASGEVLRRVDLTEGSSVAVSADGALAAIGGFDGSLRLVDLATGEQLGGPIEAHDGFTLSVDVSPDGRLVLTTGSDGRVSLWEVASRSRLADLAPGVVNTWVFGRFVDGGGTAAVAYETGATYELPTDPEAWVAHACAVAGRSFTEEEWADRFPARPYRATCP